MAIKSIECRIKEFCENYTMEGLAVVCVKLEDELEEMKAIANKYCAKCENLEALAQEPVKSVDKTELDQLRAQYQAKCIEMDKLHITIDVLIDKIANLNELAGL